MKKKSHSKNRKKSKKNMKKEDVITKEVGTINGFAIIEKLKEEKKI